MVVVLIRTEVRKDADMPAYDQLGARMEALVKQIPGFLSAKSYQSDDGDKLFIVRFESTEALARWREHPEHREAQHLGKQDFYAAYDVEICEVTRAYDFGRG